MPTNTKLRTAVLVGGLLLAMTIGLAAQAETDAELEGASILLETLIPAQAAGNSNGTNRAAELLHQLNEYREARSTLDARQRARLWTEMAFEMAGWQNTDTLQAYASIDPLTRKPVEFESLLRDLPPPHEWSELWAALQAYDATEIPKPYMAGLTLLVAALVPDAGRLESARDAYKAIASESTDEQNALLAHTFLPQIEMSIARKTEDYQQLLLVAAVAAESPQSNADSVEIPDVINLLGPDEGRIWLTRILTTARRSISVPVGHETLRVAREIAIQQIDKLQVAHWGLVTDFSSGSIFEAFQTKFPSGGSYSDLYGVKQDAQIYYLLSLVGAGRTDDAARQLRALANQHEFVLTGEMLEDLQAAGYSEQVQAFLQELLKQHHELKVWEPYFKLSARVGKAEQSANFVKELMSAGTYDSAAIVDLKARYAEALLALDDVEPALQILNETITTATSETQSDLGVKMARLGFLMDRRDLADSGIDAVRVAIEESRGQENAYWREAALKSYIKLARDLKRFELAETLLRDEFLYLKDYLHKYADLAGTAPEVYFPVSLRPLAVEVAGVYADAGRWADVIRWIDGFPYWGVEDAAQIIALTDSKEDALGLHLSAALVESGRNDEAKRVLNALLHEVPADDRIFELYSRVNGLSATAEYDRIFAADPYEERPMIWKASLLLANGDAAAAKEAIETAIAVDPSDGEQGPDNRMRAYAVYAEVLEATNDRAKAHLMKGAVSAIRLAEEADKYYDAGLYNRAIRTYEQSAVKFDGAYCVQSRLAIQLTERGRFDDAKPHYQRAYALMPDSFGRVESHCFRCENAFKDVRAQKIADKVFGDMLANGDAKATAQYMMGYLRKEQGRYAEALSFFRAAVAADPLYLNAWKQIGELAEKIHIGSWEANNAALKLRELDPLRRHSTVDYEHVTDLAALWRLSDSAYTRFKADRTGAYPLRASAAALAASARSDARGSQLANYMNAQMQGEEKIRPPGIEIAQSHLIKVAMQTMFADLTNSF